MKSRGPGIATLALLAALAAAQRAPAAGIFADGFEECGIGRWSTGTIVPLPEKLTALAPLELAEALGACAPSLVGAQFRRGDGSAPTSTELVQMQSFQSAILHAFGTGGVAPTAGGALVALSSGRARRAADPDFVIPEPGHSWFRDGDAPAVFLAAHAGDFPAPPACPSPGSSARDAVALRLTFAVPPGAERLAFDWRFFDADFPDFQCTVWRDFFLAIVVTGSSPLLPADRNVALDSQGWAVSSSTVDAVHCAGCPAGEAALAGTGFDWSPGEGAATDWRTAYVPVVPGETLVLDLVALDRQDSQWDSLVLLDGLRWLDD